MKNTKLHIIKMAKKKGSQPHIQKRGSHGKKRGKNQSTIQKTKKDKITPLSAQTLKLYIFVWELGGHRGQSTTQTNS